MLLEYSYDVEFRHFFNKLKKINNAEELMEFEGIGSQTDIAKFSKKFFSKRNKLTTADISVDSNSNVDDTSIIQYEVELAKPIHRLNAYYLLWKYGRELFSEETAEQLLRLQFTKEIYINDFHTFSGKPYCFNFSCMDVVYLGLPFVNKIKAHPPRHLSSFMGQMVQFIIYASNSIAGAVGLGDFLICSSYYVEKLFKENPSVSKEYLWKQVKQEIQSLIYSVNQPSRNGQQAPFTNISLFDKEFLKKLCDEYVFLDGVKVKPETVQKLQQIYVDLMNEALKESPITFPITTACFAVDTERNILDNNFLNFVIENNLEYGFMNIYAGETSTLSSCCRLRNETKNEYFNMFGSGGTKIGSIGVVTLNLPRIAYSAKSEKAFLEKLEELVVAASQINHIKRYIIKKRIDNGYSPLYTLGFLVLGKQYSTCGLVGFNESIELMGLNLLEESGQEFAKKILEVVNRVNTEQQTKYKSPHNSEQVPAESSAVVLASVDRMLGHNKKYSIYSNQFVPLTTKADMQDRINLQGKFDSMMSGGAILHLNFSERVTDKNFLRNLLIGSIKKGVVYQAVNYNLQSCGGSHLTVGKDKLCPVCGDKILNNFTRVVGFLVNVDNWHKVRREEDYPNRQFYGETK